MFRIRLKEAREKAGLTQKQLSLLIGKSDGVVGNWEAGSREPNLETIKKLADALNIKVSDLVDDRPHPSEIKGPLINGRELLESIGVTTWGVGKFVQIPVYGRVKAGYNEIIYNDFEGYDLFEMDDLQGRHAEDFYWLRVYGDSMEPDIREGDLALIRIEEEVNSGQVALVVIDNEDGTLKKVRYGRDYIELIAVNPSYPSLLFEEDEMDRVRIVGRVIWIKRRLW